MLVEVHEYRFYVLFFPVAVGGELALAFAAAGKVEGDEGVVFGEMGQEWESLDAVTAKSMQINDTLLAIDVFMGFLIAQKIQLYLF